MTKKLDILVHLDSMASIYDNPVKFTTADAASEIRKLRKQVEDDKADAERYRFLESRTYLNNRGWVIQAVQYIESPTTFKDDIDAAMKGK